MPPLINYNSSHELRAFMEEKGLGMRKKFGQNFLINPSVRTRLLDSLELFPGSRVWEIGPGLGAMTAGLLERGGNVTAFEIDSAFAHALMNFFGSEKKFKLIEGDVLKTWPGVPVDDGQDLFLFGNLPYNIAAVLLADFIEKGRLFKRMVVTVQREVALRMAAKPGTADYSSFSVVCSSIYKVKLLQIIKSSSFFPPPRVDSQGVRLDLDPLRAQLPVLFFPLVRSLFSSRRKIVRNTLSAFASSFIMRNPRELAEDALKKAGISGERRPETLEINEFAALAAYLEDFVSHGH